jgi:hypothetical protein
VFLLVPAELIASPGLAAKNSMLAVSKQPTSLVSGPELVNSAVSTSVSPGLQVMVPDHSRTAAPNSRRALTVTS